MKLTDEQRNRVNAKVEMRIMRAQAVQEAGPLVAVVDEDGKLRIMRDYCSSAKLAAEIEKRMADEGWVWSIAEGENGWEVSGSLPIRGPKGKPATKDAGPYVGSSKPTCIALTALDMVDDPVDLGEGEV